MKRTLGGERLHAGKKMEVDIKEYGFSNHNLSRLVTTTASAGTLIPLAHWVALPGDTFKFKDIQLSVLTHPTLGPLFGSMDATIDIFEQPWRLYLPKLHNNTADIATDMQSVKLPQIELMPIAVSTPESDVVYQDDAATHSSSLLRYMGLTNVGYWDADVWPERPKRRFNAINILGYWDTVKNYYAAKPEKILAVIDGTVIESNANVSAITVTVGNTDPAGQEIPAYPDKGGVEIVTNNWLWLELTDDQVPELQSLFFLALGDPTYYPLTDILVEGTGGIVDIMGTNYYRVQTNFNSTVIQWAWASEVNPDTAEPMVRTFPLENIDKMREELLRNVLEPTAFLINDLDFPPFNWLTHQDEFHSAYQQTQSGLALKTYKSDIFNNWLNTTDINNVLTRASVTTSGGSFNMDSLIVAQRIYDMLNTLIVSGNTYEDFLESMYSVRNLDKCSFPLYHGSLKKELVFQEVVSTAQTGESAGNNTDLGSLAGRGKLMNENSGGRMTIRTTEYGTIMAIFSLTPRIAYSQGNDWSLALENIADMHVPAMDQIGFQDAITEKAVAQDTYWDGTKWVQKSYGKQPAWLDYMTDYNRIYGLFATEEENFMVLDRRYTLVKELNSPRIQDMTSYIDPTKCNFIFAQTEIDAQNFWIQAYFNLEVRRNMSAKIMPSL